ncbi:MAG: ABC transporter permease [Candidatus Limnocylindrales bacterium]
MDALYNLPLIGLLLQLLAYLVDVVTVNGPVILALATPLTLGALCGVLNERSGVVNIGIEGMMLMSAFAGWFVCSLVNQAMPVDPSPFFGATPAILIGLLAAMATGVLASLVHAWLSISLRADQIISGTIINIVALGITGYLALLLSQQAFPTGGKFVPYTPPDFLVSLPAIGWLLRMFLQQGPITMLLIVLVIVTQVLLFRTRWGLRTRSVGEHPKAAETVGINVIRLRYRNVMLGGLVAGLGGAWLSMEVGNSFQAGMTAGRGFIGLAAMIVGRWSPLGAFGAALLFTSSQAISQSITFSPPTGQLGDLISKVPNQFYDALPYLITIVVLAGLIGRSIPPAADGVPYEREATT